MIITIKTIPHNDQRYDTTDDWIISENGDITMTVSDNENPKEVCKEILHGLTECLACVLSGVSQKEVDEYDMDHPETENPGENIDAPYHDQHMAGNVVEGLLDIFVKKVESKNNIQMDENQSNSENGGEAQIEEQSVEPQGDASIQGGSNEENANASEGEGTPKDDVQE